MNELLQAAVDNFIAARDRLVEALALPTSTSPAKPAPQQTLGSPKPKAPPKPKKGSKRTPEQLAAIADKVLVAIKSYKEPAKAEQIKKFLALDSYSWEHAIKALKESKKVNVKGERRAAVYTAATAKASPKAKKPAKGNRAGADPDKTQAE